MRRWIIGLLIAAAAFAAGLHCIVLPIVDMTSRERFAAEAHAYLEEADAKIIRAALAWAERENCLRDGDGPWLRRKLGAFTPKPHSAWYRGGGDSVVFHYEIRQAMLNHARDRAGEDGLCRDWLCDDELRRYLPADWRTWEQLYVTHFLISRYWDRPRRPLAHLQTEFRELKEKLEGFMKDCGID